jgi:hypothetical protein
LASSAAVRETQTTDEATLLGFWCRHDPNYSSDAASGLWIHLAPRRTLLPTGQRSLKTATAVPELLRTA